VLELDDDGCGVAFDDVSEGGAGVGGGVGYDENQRRCAQNTHTTNTKHSRTIGVGASVGQNTASPTSIVAVDEHSTPTPLHTPLVTPPVVTHQ
jgi:hypothetical protein